MKARTHYREGDESRRVLREGALMGKLAGLGKKTVEDVR